MTIVTFKILISLAPPVLSKLLQKREYLFRYSNTLLIPKVRAS